LRNTALKTDKQLTDLTASSNENLNHFAGYLKQLQQDNPELVAFNIQALQNDIDKGMYFDSSIPQGYGVGSSGALVAAIYDKYATQKITILENLTREKLLALKKIFAAMESFFHGKSSGLDPLNSYLSLPILINSTESYTQNITSVIHASQEPYNSGSTQRHKARNQQLRPRQYSNAPHQSPQYIP
jgi:mevalonate kinase